MTVLMTIEEHLDVYGAIAESIVADPPQTGDLDERVLKGCELLDRVHPGWADKIDLRTFQLQESSRCVVGQVYGDYDQVTRLLPTASNVFVSDVEEEHGFCVQARSDDEGGDVEEVRQWELLEHDWRVAIAERQ